MKTFQKLLAVILCVLILLPSVTAAFAVDVTTLTFLYLDKGDIVLGDGTVSAYGQYGERITQPNDAGYCITTNTNDAVTNSITVTGGAQTILLRNVNVKSSDQFKSPFRIDNGAEVDLQFTGNNTITGGAGRAGIEVAPSAFLRLGGDGVLTATSVWQAGIGGGSGASNGTIVIDSGTIYASSQYESAGIGGGSSGDGGTITINGGAVVATGGSYAAGIGGGSGGSGGTITINGGTVTAAGGTYGAGIGGGWYGDMGNITINGGSVKAIAGTDAAAVGGGKGRTGAQPVNDAGSAVYPVTVSAVGAGDITQTYVNGVSSQITGKHPYDDRFYFWLPAGTHTVAVKPVSASPLFFLVAINASGSVTQQTVAAPTAKNGASIGTDDVIRGITCGLTNLDDYLTLPQGFSLAYDQTPIGTGTAVKLMYGDTELYRYRALLYGDLNNDGWYDGEDSMLVLLMLWRMLNASNTDAIVLEAADVNFDGSITEADMHLLEQAGLFLAEVGQNGANMQTDAYTTYLSMIPQSEPQAQDTVEPPAETPAAPSFLQKLLIFIKNVIKILYKVDSFWNI